MVSTFHLIHSIHDITHIIHVIQFIHIIHIIDITHATHIIHVIPLHAYVNSKHQPPVATCNVHRAPQASQSMWLHLSRSVILRQK